MSSGILWFDDDKKRSFEEKVILAVKYCQDKRDFTPVRVEVNPSAVLQEMKVGKVLVTPSKNVLLHHFFLIREGV